MDRPREKRFWTRRRLGWGLFALALFPLAVYALMADLGVSRYRADPRRLTLAAVERGPFQEYIPVSGNVLPFQTVYLETAEGGRVEEILVEEGGAVAAGDAILRLANTDLQLEILRREDQLAEQLDQLFNTRVSVEQERREAERRLAELEHQILTRRRTYERNAALFEEELISRLELELSRDEYQFLLQEKERALAGEERERAFRQARVEQMEQSVERMRRNLATAREKLDKLTIRAPIDGALTSLEAEVGQSMPAGQRLGQIDAAGGFKVRAAVDQLYISRVGAGREATVEVDGHPYQLAVTKVYPEVADGRFDIDLEFDGAVPPGIRRGQSLQLRVALGEVTAEALLLPRGAFQQTTGGRWAYVVEEGGEHAVKRPIRLGRQNVDYFEVLEGLEAGERVIVSSYETFGDVDRVVFRGD